MLFLLSFGSEQGGYLCCLHRLFRTKLLNFQTQDDFQIYCVISGIIRPWSENVPWLILVLWNVLDLLCGPSYISLGEGSPCTWKTCTAIVGCSVSYTCVVIQSYVFLRFFIFVCLFHVTVFVSLFSSVNLCYILLKLCYHICTNVEFLYLSGESSWFLFFFFF